jgi:hypothetical protein
MICSENNNGITKNIALLKEYFLNDYTIKILFYARRQDERIELLYYQHIRKRRYGYLKNSLIFPKHSGLSS